MNEDLTRDLEALARRGEPRGHGEVLRAARSGPTTQRRARTGVRLVAVASAVAVLAAAAVALRPWDGSDPEPSASGSTTTTSSTNPSPVHALNASSLVLFDDCSALLDELQARANDHVGPYGLTGVGGWGMYYGAEEYGGFARRAPTLQSVGGPVPVSTKISSTNTQEVGIDEPDIVETDGERLFVLRDGTLRVVDVGSARLTDTLSLGLVNTSGAVLVDDMLVVFANEPLSDRTRGEAKVVLVDVAGSPAVRERLTATGVLVDARVVDERVHVVLASSPTLAFTYPTSSGKEPEDAATAANRERIASSTIDDWMPHWRVTDGSGEAVLDEARITACDQVRHPQTFAGFDQTTLLTLDLDDLDASQATSVVASSQLVYGSSNSVYVATASYEDLLSERSGSRTDVHRFAIDSSPAYAASGRVEGYVADQFGFSEHNGRLRVASSTVDGERETRVTVLVERDGELVTTGVVSGLGRGEDIQGVRFVGDLGYVVTFRRTDPLFVIDLRDPVNPRLAGQLQVPGYSAYLHPVADGIVLGVGHDGTADGRLTGAAVSLFDVRDPANPSRADLEAFGPTSTPLAESDHHAFTWWPDTGTAYIPVGVLGSPSRVQVVEVRGGDLRAVGAIEATGAGAGTAEVVFDRVVLVGNRLLSISPDGVQISDLSTLAPVAWVPFSR